MNARRVARFAFPLVLAPACVAYDTAGPPVPRIDGIYATTITVSYSNHIEVRNDTLLALLRLEDTGYRGHFAGSYRTVFGDSGLFSGVERPESTLVVDIFGAPPKPIAYVMGLRQLYPWCDFPRLGVGGPLNGRLRGDTLRVDATASLPCFYQLYGAPTEIGTELRLTLVGVR